MNSSISDTSQKIPFISVITISYNNLMGLQRTVSSVLNQEYKNFEYIIIDGGSNDGSKIYLSELKLKYTKIISEKDKGIYDAMNKGISNSIGEFLIFMNSGDCFANSKSLKLVETEISKIKNRPNFIYADSFEKNYENGLKYYKKAKNHSNYWYGMFAHHQSMLFANVIIKKNKLTYNLKYQSSADWEFVIRFLNCIDLKTDVRYLAQPIAIFELGGISRNYMQGIKEQFTIRNTTLGWNKTSCLLIAIYHYSLNIIRQFTPFIYNYYVKLRSG